MKLKLTPYPEKKKTKNKWVLEIDFMHGDADGNTTEKYSFEECSHFEKVYNFFAKCIAFKDKYHNLMIDLWDREEDKEATILSMREDGERYKTYGYSAKELKEHLDANERCINDLIEFLGDNKTISGMLEGICDEIDYDVDIPGDITSDHQFRASISRIKDMCYYDEDGKRHKISVE